MKKRQSISSKEQGDMEFRLSIPSDSPLQISPTFNPKTPLLKLSTMQESTTSRLTTQPPIMNNPDTDLIKRTKTSWNNLRVHINKQSSFNKLEEKHPENLYSQFSKLEILNNQKSMINELHKIRISEVGKQAQNKGFITF